MAQSFFLKGGATQTINVVTSISEEVAKQIAGNAFLKMATPGEVHPESIKLGTSKAERILEREARKDARNTYRYNMRQHYGNDWKKGLGRKGNRNLPNHAMPSSFFAASKEKVSA